MFNAFEAQDIDAIFFHQFQGYKEDRHKVVYTKKQNYYDKKGEQKHHKVYDDFDAMFKKHKQGYKHSNLFHVS